MSDPAVPAEPLEPPPPPGEPPPPAASAGSYPVILDCERQEEYNRFLPLVKWLLALPHYLVLFVLFIAGFFAWIYAFFAVLFTGRYPRGVFDFLVGLARWSWNVTAYVYLLTDKYPAFELKASPDSPAVFDVEYPETVNRWRPLVHWLLIIPFAIVAGLLTYVSGIVALIGVFVILFTKNLPEGMFKLILIPYRWYYRASIYAAFMVTRYPPFEWDE